MPKENENFVLRLVAARSIRIRLEPIQIVRDTIWYFSDPLPPKWHFKNCFLRPIGFEFKNELEKGVFQRLILLLNVTLYFQCIKIRV